MKLIGLARLGRDGEMDYMPDGTAKLKLSLAYNYGKKGSDGKQPTQWVSAALFGQRAESVEQYMTKGKLLYVELADPRVVTFNKRDGTQGTALEAVLDRFEFAGGGGQREERSEAPPAQTTRTREAAPDADDDIPF